jgi:DNA-binding IclR family transcriptional regulator
MDVLFYLAAEPQGANLSKIAGALQFPRTTVFDILKTLMKNDFVQYINAKKKIYGIGSQVYAIGITYLESSRLFQITRPYLSLLADKYEKTTFIAKRHNERVIHIYKYASPYTKAPTSNIGDQKMLHCTAIGKCYLAFDPDAAPLIETIDLVPLTPYTITSRERLKEQIQQFRTLGYSCESRESHELMACLAAPIIGSGGMTATISMTGYYREDEDFSSQGHELAQLSKIISRQLEQAESQNPASGSVRK